MVYAKPIEPDMPDRPLSPRVGEVSDSESHAFIVDLGTRTLLQFVLYKYYMHILYTYNLATHRCSIFRYFGPLGTWCIWTLWILNWVAVKAVKELKLGYHSPEARTFTIYPSYGNLH